VLLYFPEPEDVGGADLGDDQAVAAGFERVGLDRVGLHQSPAAAALLAFLQQPIPQQLRDEALQVSVVRRFAGQAEPDRGVRRHSCRADRFARCLSIADRPPPLERR
jgi:hypothetical protein